MHTYKCKHTSLRNEQSLETFKKGLTTHLFKIAFVK